MRAIEFLSENSTAVFQQLISDILKIVPSAYEIWFYGSRARGDHRPSSDYDILVMVPDEIVGGDFLDLQLALEKLTAKYKNFDVQASHSWNIIGKSARVEGKLIWSKESLNEIKISGPDPKVKDFISYVYNKFPATFQNNHLMIWGEGDNQELAMFELVPSLSKRMAVELKWFQAYPLRKGIGSRAMQILQQMAEENGISLTLYPWDKGQISQSKLIKFYKKLGFSPTAKGSKNMFWEPAKKLDEGLAHPIIVVDVQPEYCGANRVCQRVVNFVQNQTGPVLMFVNAEDQGQTGDTIESIRTWWEESAGGEWDEDSGTFNEVIDWSRFQIVDKGYGYLRSWMDYGIEPKIIIATIRELYLQKKNDSRELNFPPFNQRTITQSLIMGAIEEMEDDPLIVNWTSVAQLKRFSGAYIVGGGRNQCLREVELLMNAFNIRYKRIDSLVY